MAVVSQTHDTSRLPSGPLQKATLKASLRQKVTHESGTVAKQATSHEVSSVLFDMACMRFGQKNEALALTISENTGSTVSGSLVGRWRRVDAREVPNDAQIVALGSEFNRIHQRLKSEHFGWGRQVMLDLIRDLGDLAEEIA